MIVFGFLGIVGWSAHEQWLPAKAVTANSPVILAKAELQQAGTPLFQAAGWVEPRPSAVMAAALVEGVVSAMLVVEGQEVTAGEPVARLVDDEAQIAVKRCGSYAQATRGRKGWNRGVVTAAKSDLERPVHLEAALAEGEAALAQIETELRTFVCGSRC